MPTIGLIRDLGITTINEVSVSFESYCGVVHDTILSNLDLDMFEYHVFAFDRKWVSPPGSHGLKMWINSVDGEPDGNLANDTLVKNIEFGREEIN
ncbi:MAG: hypothetical protein U9R60_18925 [Bacteroidota bacterium]|nr:hypothetical protein [Bacteroidota bacterium]